MNTPDLSDDELDPLLRGVVAELRTPVEPRAAARDALRQAIHADARAIPPRLTVERGGGGAARDGRPRRAWLFESRVVRTSPLGVLAAAALLIVVSSTVTTLVARRGAASVPSAMATTAASMAGTAKVDGTVVRFTLQAPTAKQVALVGDFNGWDPAATRLELRDGVWSVVIPISPGRHQYGFVVDGSRWSADPAAPQAAESDFGSENSVVYVGS